MEFDIARSIEILERTPKVLEALLGGISASWLRNNEGENTWSPYEVVGHLIHGECTDWIPRTRIILSEASDKTFEPFDRFAQQAADDERSVDALIAEFAQLRQDNLEELRGFALDEAALGRKGIHPELGAVDLRQLLSTWVVHDLGHLAQISRVMAKQYEGEVGPWSQYLGILKR